MTIGIGAIQHDPKQGSAIITVVDRRLSIYGGYFSHEGPIVKVRSVHPEWQVIFAGDASEATPLLDAVMEGMQNLKRNETKEVVDRCRAVYMRERRRMIETEILPDYDLDDYDELISLRKNDLEFHRMVNEAIRQAEEGWSLLFAGFDKDGGPHLFVISERGKISYCDIQKYAAIGIGAVAAGMWLGYYPYSSSLSLGEAVSAVAASKFFAEKASDVGRKTFITITRAGQKTGLLLTDSDLKPLRAKWERLPKLPKKEADKLHDTISGHLALYKMSRVSRETDNEPKPSASQT